MAEKAQILLDIDVKDSPKTLGDLEDNLDKINEAIRQVPKGSEDFKILKQELINTSKEVKNMELSFESLDSEQVASSLGGVAGAVGDISAAFVL